MARNSQQVTQSDYARCVAAQVAFLHGREGSTPGMPVTADTVADYYENGVSVDAAAALLLRIGY